MRNPEDREHGGKSSVARQEREEGVRHGAGGQTRSREVL